VSVCVVQRQFWWLDACSSNVQQAGRRWLRVRASGYWRWTVDGSQQKVMLDLTHVDLWLIVCEWLYCSEEEFLKWMIFRIWKNQCALLRWEKRLWGNHTMHDVTWEFDFVPSLTLEEVCSVWVISSVTNSQWEWLLHMPSLLFVVRVSKQNHLDLWSLICTDGGGHLGPLNDDHIVPYIFFKGVIDLWNWFRILSWNRFQIRRTNWLR